MKTYETSSQAIDSLRKEGYLEEFSLHPHSLISARHSLELHPEDFEIVEVYRFEGDSNPDDNTVIYVIRTKEGHKGLLIDAYGMYSEEVTSEMANKLRRKV